MLTLRPTARSGVVAFQHFLSFLNSGRAAVPRRARVCYIPAGMQQPRTAAPLPPSVSVGVMA